jgi:hypothetical protein
MLYANRNGYTEAMSLGEREASSEAYRKGYCITETPIAQKLFMYVNYNCCSNI